MEFGELLGLWTHPWVWGDTPQLHRDRSSSTWDSSRHHPTHLFIWLFICILCHKPVSPKGNQSQVFIGRTDAEAKAPILWPPHVKSWLIGKDPDAGKDWGQEEKGMTENEMVGWHHRLDGHELSKLWEMVRDREAWRATVHEVAKSWIQLNDWKTTVNQCKCKCFPEFYEPFSQIMEPGRESWEQTPV